MLVVRTGSSHENRLIHEGHVLRRRLKKMARAIGGGSFARDYEVEKLNHDLCCDVVGLIALKSRIGFLTVTLICAPGAYFSDRRPERRKALNELAAARRAAGRRTLVVSKHEALGHVPYDLSKALGVPAGLDRRNVDALLSGTGRRAPGSTNARSSRDFAARRSASACLSDAPEAPATNEVVGNSND